MNFVYFSIGSLAVAAIDVSFFSCSLAARSLSMSEVVGWPEPL